MLLKQLILVFFGLSAGGVIAAGIFAFLAMIGVFPRLMGRTGTAKHILLYETLIIVGGICGNVLDIFEIPIPLGAVLPLAADVFMAVFGICSGVFVGCLVMSLAETLRALPVMNRRIHLAVGFQYLVLSIAIGKLAGSLIYFINGFAK